VGGQHHAELVARRPFDRLCKHARQLPAPALRHARGWTPSQAADADAGCRRRHAGLVAGRAHDRVREPPGREQRCLFGERRRNGGKDASPTTPRTISCLASRRPESASCSSASGFRTARQATSSSS
jgi:hypothetical protein